MKSLLISLVLATLLVGPALSQRAAEADGDSDGVPDLQDPCPLTPRGVATIIPGCSALDLVESVSVLVAPLNAELAETAQRTAARAELIGATRDVETSLSLLVSAEDSI